MGYGHEVRERGIIVVCMYMCVERREIEGGVEGKSLRSEFIWLALRKEISASFFRLKTVLFRSRESIELS